MEENQSTLRKATNVITSKITMSRTQLHNLIVLLISVYLLVGMCNTAFLCLWTRISTYNVMVLYTRPLQTVCVHGISSG